MWFRRLPLSFAAALMIGTWLGGERASAQTFAQNAGPQGGRISAMCSDVRTAHLFAGVWDGGLYRSLDDGDTWQRLALDEPALRRITQLATLSPSSPLFAGTDADGVLLSSDAGLTWIDASAGLQGTHIEQLHVRDDEMFALAASIDGFPSGLLHRWDAATQHWQFIESPTPLDQIVANSTGNVDPTDVLLGSSAGIGLFRTFDGGANWDKPPGIGARTFATIGERIHASSGFNGVVYSDDNADTWFDISAGLTQDTHVSILAAHDATLFAYGYPEILRRLPDAKAWQIASAGLPLGQARHVACLTPHAQSMFAGTWSGPVRSNDLGENWQPAFEGMVATRVTSLAAFDGVALATVAADPSINTAHNAVYRSIDGGQTWETITAGLPADSNLLHVASSSSALFAGTLRDGVYRSDDGGLTWTIASSGLPTSPSGAGGVLYYEVRHITAIGDTLFAGVQPRFSHPDHGVGQTQGGGMYRSTDGGVSWVAINSGLPLLGTHHPPFSYQYRPRVTGLTALGSTLLLGTREHGVFRSSNGGDSWTAVNAGLPANAIGAFPQFTSFAARQGIIYASSIGHWPPPSPESAGVYASLDDGVTWDALTAQPAQQRSVIVVISICDDLYAAVGCPPFEGYCDAQAGDGVYRSIDGGGSWQQVSAPIDGASIASLAALASPDQSMLLAGTLAFGAWSAELPCGVAGDANHDGEVDVDDLIAVILAWGPCPAPPFACPADIAPAPGDGQVNVDDLIAVNLQWEQ